jgi:hypothetical protein
MVPFTPDQFFDLFAAYNLAIWPTPIAAYVLGVVALGALAIRDPAGHRIGWTIVGLLWLWNGVAYHLLFFSRINLAAYGFAALFVAQGLLFLAFAFARQPHATRSRSRASKAGGAALIIYAIVVYPALGAMAGHAWPRAPVFGVAPCPTTIFTFGVMMLSWRAIPGWLLAIPLTWATIGSTAAVLLSVPEDLGLLAAGLIAAGWLVVRRMTSPTADIARHAD